MAASEAAREGVWLGVLMADLIPGWSGPISIMCDNSSTIALIKNPVLHQRSKHILRKHKFASERQQEKQIDVVKISSANQLADPLTKPFPNPQFSLLREKMGIVSSQ